MRMMVDGWVPQPIQSIAYVIIHLVGPSIQRGDSTFLVPPRYNLRINQVLTRERLKKLIYG